MNTTTQRTVTHLLDPHWIAAIQEEIESNSGNVAFAVEPDVCGQYDAEHGFPCDPLSRGYRKLADVELYCVAYHDTTALWAEIIQAKNDSLCNEVDIDGQLQQLIDGIDDELFWRKGC